MSEKMSSQDLLARLVAFDTTSRSSNLALIEFVRDYLATLGVEARVSVDPTGRKANLHALVGPAVAGGIALSGHVDTVPVDGQAWTGDPFTLRVADGKLIARGAADMKGFVACMLAAVPRLKAMRLAKPVHLFVTHDEETTMEGARRMVAELDTGPRPACCVVGEPTLLQPVLAHKGKLSLRVIVRGKPGHSSEPAKGVNAVQAAAEAVAWVASEARARAKTGPFDARFDPPYTTIHVGTMAGGTILNIIPEHAEFTMEWRDIPFDDVEAEFARLRAHVAAVIEPSMRAVDPASGFSYEVIDTIPGLALPERDPLVAMVQQASGSNSVGAVSYGTEGGLYERAGIPTIVCGPGAIAQAHQPDEWIAASQLLACDAFIDRLAERLSG
ncbi:MAG: acetylornithine deacetylase [Rhodospirillales bacterium]|nr:acetylornithine deacetylase [Rhodospirillales bacterium]